jgi:transposase
MISLQGDTRILIALGPTDMRKGFDALAAIVAHSLKLDPLSGQLFLFFNRRRDKMKILYWDRDGLAIWYRRLEQGTYQVPQADATSHSVEVRAEELMMILRGGATTRTPSVVSDSHSPLEYPILIPFGSVMRA